MNLKEFRLVTLGEIQPTTQENCIKFNKGKLYFCAIFITESTTLLCLGL